MIPTGHSRRNRRQDTASAAVASGALSIIIYAIGYVIITSPQQYAGDEVLVIALLVLLGGGMLLRLVTDAGPRGDLRILLAVHGFAAVSAFAIGVYAGTSIDESLLYDWAVVVGAAILSLQVTGAMHRRESE